MPSPNVNTVHVDAILTNISVAYIQSLSNFVADKVFPVIPVDKKSNIYYTYTKADWFRDEAQRRADATASAGSGYGLSTDNYECDVFAFHKDIGDQTRDNADQPLNPDKEATQFVTQRLLLRKEVQWAADFFTSGVWNNQVSGASTCTGTGVSAYGTSTTFYWSDYTNALPVVDVQSAKMQVLSTTGFEPNTLVLGYKIFQVLKNHPTLLDRYKYTTPGAMVTEQLLANLFEVDRILIPKAIYNTGNEGTNAQNYGFITSNSALLCYVAPNPGLLTPSAGYSFLWTKVSQGVVTGNGSPATVGVAKFRMDELKADRVEGEIAFDNKVVAPDLGFFWYNILGNITGIIGSPS